MGRLGGQGAAYDAAQNCGTEGQPDIVARSGAATMVPWPRARARTGARPGARTMARARPIPRPAAGRLGEGHTRRQQQGAQTQG